jgi:predicted component of type VI protein secretion system
LAKLLVFRGETFLREIELGRQTFRIGRSEQNDLVLEDPGKAVSRNHAEIRFEGGQYVLADLESQNGIWVSGARVPFVVLEPKTAASVGPYRLTLEVDPPTQTDFVLPPDELLDAPTEFSTAMKAEPRVTEAVARPTPTPIAEKPTPKPSVPKPTPKPAPKKPAANAATPPWLLIGGAALAVVVIAAVVVMRFRTPSVPPDSTQQQVETLLADARGLIDRSDCARAMSDAINPALALQPNNADALALKTRAGACLPPPPPVDPAPVAMTAEEVTEHLRVAEEAIARRECEAALTEHINRVLEKDPTNQQAVDLKVKAETCPPLVVKAPQAPQAPAPKLAVKIPAENGGLEPTSGELDKDYQVRVRAMRTKYDEAVGILASGAYTRAIPALQSVARDATNRYLDIASKLSEARKGAAAQAMNEARDFESKNDYDQAVLALRRAAAADPDPKIDDDLKRVGEKRTQAGLKACDDGKNAYAFNRPQQALQFYQQVVRLLPADHPCTVTAKERIAALSR